MIIASASVLPVSKEYVVDEDMELAERFAAGDERALKAMYDRWGRVIYTLAVRSTGDPAEAEDITQRTFVSWPEYMQFRKRDFMARYEPDQPADYI